MTLTTAADSPWFARLGPRRRTLRMASGLVLFTYVAAHLINHALGLVSLELAELGLGIAVWFWHSRIGTVLLYSSASVHVVLAFYALYERRTLRMPVIEWVRIVMGFGMPVLLIGHVIATRGAFEVYGLAPEYSRVIHGLWSSNNEWLQLGLLAPGWIHGCLGLHIALGHRRFYRRGFLIWFSLALLLPVLSGLGFLMMSKEVINKPPPQPAAVNYGPTHSPNGNPREGIRDMRQTALNTYLLIFGLLIGARGIRKLVELNRKSVIQVSLPGRSFSMPKGWTVLEGMRSHGIKHLSVCGGRGRCSTCRIRVVSGLATCPLPAGVEFAMLQRTRDPREVRLACQLRPSADLVVAPLFRAEAVEVDLEHAVTRSLAPVDMKAENDRTILLIQVARASAAASVVRLSLLPDDARFVMQQMIVRIEPMLRPFAASIAEFGSDYLMLVFERESSDPDPMPRMFAALRKIEQAMAALEELVNTELAMKLNCRLYLHDGPVLLSSLSVDGKLQSLVFGATASVLRRASQHQSGVDARWLLSDSTLEILDRPRGNRLGDFLVADAAVFGEMAETQTRFFAFASIQQVGSAE